MDQTPRHSGPQGGPQGQGDDDGVPAALREALGRAYRSSARLDLEALDARVLGASATRLSSGPATRLVLWRRAGLIGGGLAAAAGLALVVLVWKPWTTPGASVGLASTSGDLNGDGTLNILDALALSNALRAESAGGPGDASRDVNGDGAVDERDVDALALRVVSLGGAG